MPLIPINLADELLAATNQMPTAAAAMIKMGISIAMYIQSNAILNFAWVGVHPSTGAPDPMVAPPGNIISCFITLAPSGASIAGLGTQQLAMDITNSMRATTYNITGYPTAPGVMADIPPLSLNIAGVVREVAMMQMATQICTWLQTYKPATPCAGQSPGGFVGSGQVTAII